MINPLFVHELEEVHDMAEETKQRFQIVDMASLTWVLRKMAAIEAKKQEMNQVVNAELDRLEAFRKKELDRLQEHSDFFQYLMDDYAHRRRDEDATFKSEKTPYGSIRFRKQQPKWNYDEEQLVDFLEKNDYLHLIRTKKEPIKTEIKKCCKPNTDGRVFDGNGQEVAGITVEYFPDKLEIQVEALR